MTPLLLALVIIAVLLLGFDSLLNLLNFTLTLIFPLTSFWPPARLKLYKSVFALFFCHYLLLLYLLLPQVQTNFAASPVSFPLILVLIFLLPQLLNLAFAILISLLIYKQ